MHSLFHATTVLLMWCPFPRPFINNVFSRPFFHVLDQILPNFESGQRYPPGGLTPRLLSRAFRLFSVLLALRFLASGRALRP